MQHKAKIVKVEPVGDGLVVLHAECCGDKDTHKRHTTVDLDNIEREIKDHLARVEIQHERKLKAIATVERLMAQEIQ